ncbi:MAG: hypothetical protein MK033_09195 [Candidatus Caenarcaniphilales bacterium]|nr:hypothetical protein [Candidatus Caenarcaniphilales bacterium]
MSLNPNKIRELKSFLLQSNNPQATIDLELANLYFPSRNIEDLEFIDANSEFKLTMSRFDLVDLLADKQTKSINNDYKE